MFVTFCWEDHGSMEGDLSMMEGYLSIMEGEIHTPLRSMVVNM